MTAAGFRVWDLPTRIFHWTLAVLLAFSWWSAENREMEWHVWSGIVILGLVAFRLIWGVLGGSTARFSRFVRAPGYVLTYIRGRSTDAIRPGHNPLGGYSVLILLAALALQVSTGLFATDIDGLDSGPLSYMVSFEAGRAAAEIHEIAFNVLLAFVVLHLAAVLYYVVINKRSLVRPMITGRSTENYDPEDSLVPAGPIRLVLALVSSAALAWWIAGGAGG